MQGLPVYGQPMYGPPLKPPPVEIRIDQPTRRSLVWETRFVMAAFLVPAIGGAIVPLVQYAEGVSDIDRFPTFVQNNPLTNMILGMVTYIGLGAVVPVTLFLLSRTGNTPKTIGLGVPKFVMDIWPALGLAALSYVCEIAILIPFSPFLTNDKNAVSSPTIGNVPHYYVIYGIFIAAVTSITEEVLVNGYLLVRLEQLGWTNRSAFILSLVLRMSYHIYYGVGFLLLLPFGYFITRSFQKHRRLNRCIAAHFIYDAVLITISILK
ncbi:MAG: CPBP family intramembrane glutamic endopeptidase [Acidimicrobiales bacterium]